MRKLSELLLFLLIFSAALNARESVVWEADTSGQIRIYSIKFINSSDGWAESFLGDVLKTTDGGNTWKVLDENQNEKYQDKMNTDVVGGWSANIFCAVMKSTDGGESWKPYPKKMEEHFCQVYFKDENTGWKVAEEFLSGVIDTIKIAIKTGDYESKTGVVHKCREYYTKIDEGWTLGWHFNDLVTEENNITRLD